MLEVVAPELHAPGRRIHVRPGDRFLVSYPRSGNTWTRFLISHLPQVRETTSGRVDFQSIRVAIPDIYIATRRQLTRTPDPRLLKSHEFFDARYPRVVLIVRDPRDVLISYFHFHRRHDLWDAGLEEFVERFLAGTLDPYGRWDSHVESWLLGRGHDPSFLLVRYEDLKAETAHWLTRIVEHLDLRADEQEIHRAIAASDPEKMRKLDRENVAAGGALPGTRPGFDFVRAARPGQGTTELSRSHQERVREAFGCTLTKLGYSTDG